MPPTPPPADEYWPNLITRPGFVQQMAGQQQNKTIVNAQGQPVINEGLIPGSSPAAYGWQFVNPATGGQLLFIGEDGSGNAYVAFYDGAGNQRIKIDEMGIHVGDASGNNRVNLGELGNGDYGLQVIDVLGNSEEILPAVAQYVDPLISISSTTYVSDGGPSVTVEVGASGNVLLTASAFIETFATNISGFVGLYQDGNFVKDILVFGSADAIGNANTTTTRVITGLTPGSHTWELRYKTSGATASSFAARSLVVTPT